MRPSLPPPVEAAEAPADAALSGAYWQSEMARTALERAGVAARMPISVHGYDDGVEIGRLTGCGTCAACTAIAATPWGRKYCGNSRANAAVVALRRGQPEPFLCHAGLACVTVPIPGQEGCPAVLTVGPYCPDGTRPAVEKAYRQRLDELSATARSELPAPMQDLPELDTVSAVALAEWTAETLAGTRLSRDTTSGPAETPDPVETPRGPNYRKRRYPRPVRDPYQAADIAAAIAAGDQDRMRMLVRRLLSDCSTPGRAALAVCRRRAVAVAGAVFEAAERLGLDTSKTNAAYEDLPKLANRCEDADQLVRALTRLFAKLKRRATVRAARAPLFEGYPELYRFLLTRLVDPVTLDEAAALLGEKPDTLAKRINRKTGMSYSEFYGRLRIDKAKELLQSPALSVKDVAYRLGFNDPANFAKLFRRYENVSPSAYRKTGP